MPHSSSTGDRVRPVTRRRTLAVIGAALAAGTVVATGTGVQAFTGDPSPAHRTLSRQPVMRTLTPQVRAQLDRAVQHVLRTTHTPGVTVGLWAPGKGSYVRAFGTADKATRQPMSPGFNMRIGSVTKTFTVTALLRLVDHRQVSLDDPISKYVRGVPNGRHITLRHLAEMRSGLFNALNDEDFAKAFMADTGRTFTDKELLAYAFKHPVAFPAGSQFQYSNTNTILLSMVVEKVTGQPFDRYLTRHVLKPAHLRHTFVPKGAEFPAPHAHGYTDQASNDGSITDATNWAPPGGASGVMISNLRDLRSWASTLTEGTLLSRATQAERLKMLPTDREGLSYGLGIFDVNGWIGHNGSLPGYQTVMVHLPKAKATLVVHTTSDINVEGKSLTTKFAKAVTDIVTPKNVYDIPTS
ncbi:serine hydrolase domain-containing protein [Streptomyces sp. 142MFCol3.1]|uniref:serine hydrolase domain-containing protein n=1 Tax=Streptomyces sp. 142MFCol3.1 TaxID=1172179 RepID=UPI00041897C3|nr:serine hydrolase domain-containing protein [Streptomyces sp. 142MFCol3.1]